MMKKRLLGNEFKPKGAEDIVKNFDKIMSTIERV